MQKAFLVLSFFSVMTVFSFAQLPDPGARSFTFAFSPFANSPVSSSASHTGTLLFKYYKTTDLALRFSGSIYYSNNTSTNDNGSLKTTNTYINNTYGLGFGFQKNLATINKFSIYGGTDLAVGFGNNKSDNRSETYAINKPGGAGTIGDFKETLTVQKNPFTINLYPFLGVNYFFSKNFSIGAEFSMLLGYNFPGSGNIDVTQRANGVDYPEIKSNTATGSSFNINPASGSLLTVSVYW